MRWWTQAIGVPFRDRGRDPSGWDCWGLVHWHYARLRFTELPDRPEVSALDLPAVANSAVEGLSKGPWQRIDGLGEPLDLVIVWRHYEAASGGMIAAPIHCGLVTMPGLILHCDYDTGTVVTRFAPEPHASLRSRRFDVYRYRVNP